MRHELHIQLRSAEGAVLRALGLMERRGFKLASCEVSEAQGDGVSMDVCLTSERPTDLIKRQLERLHDVLWVNIKQPTNAWAETAGPRGAGSPFGGS